MSTLKDGKARVIKSSDDYDSDKALMIMVSSSLVAHKLLERVLERVSERNLYRGISGSSSWEYTPRVLAYVAFLHPEYMEQLMARLDEVCVLDRELWLLYRQFCEEYSRVKVLQGMISD